MSLHNPAEPVVILETESYRCVLRALPRDTSGIVDIEARGKDALGAVTWHQKCCVSLRITTRQSDELDVLQEILRQIVKDRGIVLRP